jgi:1,2-diacylglycerol 3-alpha-glucosyltransferase
VRDTTPDTMRLVIATQTYDLHINGQGVFAVHLAEGLARAGHEVLVLAPSDRLRAYRRVQNGVQIQFVTAIPLGPMAPNVHVTPLPGPVVHGALDDFRPQVVHVQDHYPLCRSVVHAAVERDLPLVATNHFLPENMVDEVSLFRLFPEVISPVLWKTVLDVFNQADVVTSPTETAAEILRQQDLRVPVQAISNGVDLQRFYPYPRAECTAMRQQYDLDPERIVLLFVGRIQGEKRLDVLIHALQRLDRADEHRDDVQLAIAGRGAQRKELEEMARDLVTERGVVFVGFVPDEDLPCLLNSADIFAMPSDAELQSIATLEAMAAGRPILAANARALPELVRDGVNGYLFEHGNAEEAARCLVELIDHRDDWPAMGAASREIALEHDLAKTIRRYEELYRTLLSPSPRV